VCEECARDFPISAGVVDLRVPGQSPVGSPFYSIPSYRVFAANQHRIHEAHYRDGSFSNGLENWMKESLLDMKRDLREPVVELGCGGTPNLEWVSVASSYLGVDQSIDLLQGAKAANPDSTFVCAELPTLPFFDHSVGTIVANAVLEHVFHLDSTVSEMARCLLGDGRLYVLVPTEGGLAVGMARLFTSTRNARLLGLTAAECRVAQRRDHCNTVFAIENALRKYFEIETQRLWPFGVGGVHLNLAKAWVLRPLHSDGVASVVGVRKKAP
jgi:SAM-dependent methyltransferase